MFREFCFFITLFPPESELEPEPPKLRSLEPEPQKTGGSATLCKGNERCCQIRSLDQTMSEMISYVVGGK